MNDSAEQRLEEVREKLRLLNEGDRDVYTLTSARGFLEVTKKFVDRICDRIELKEPADLSTSLFLRCIARKTQESLSTIIGLAEGEQAYYAMALLRPMCEELIFARFLKSLPRAEADEYARNKVILEILEGLQAQKSFFDEAQEKYSIEESWRGDPHPAELQSLSESIDKQKSLLTNLGKGHSYWGRQPTPKVKQMAERTNSLAEYEFFYHAASSAVHANLHHLGRMVWGDPIQGIMSITNEHFNSYYRAFVLTYGVWLAFEVMEEVREEFANQWPEEETDIYVTWMAALIVPAISLRQPPIVTTEELRWPRRPSKRASET